MFQEAEVPKKWSLVSDGSMVLSFCGKTNLLPCKNLLKFLKSLKMTEVKSPIACCAVCVRELDNSVDHALESFSCWFRLKEVLLGCSV